MFYVFNIFYLNKYIIVFFIFSPAVGGAEAGFLEGERGGLGERGGTFLTSTRPTKHPLVVYE